MRLLGYTVWPGRAVDPEQRPPGPISIVVEALDNSGQLFRFGLNLAAIGLYQAAGETEFAQALAEVWWASAREVECESYL